ncbi:GlsB/YeaQ/YmgE family stress response membrane protein [Microvirga sp. P5_D2]
MTKKLKPGPSRSRTQRKPTPSNGYRSPVRISIDREVLAALDKRAIAAQVGVGVVAGWLASWLVGGSGLLQYVITGLAGSLIGGFLLERLGIDLGIRNPLAHRIATATLGAMVIVLLARIIG